MKTQSAVFEMAVGTPQQLPPSNRPEVAFIGRSNVGKSSLINKLLLRKGLARTSATPGKTATINFYGLEDCRLVDLPGYGYAKASHAERQRLQQLIEAYLQDDRDLRLIIQLMDRRHPPVQSDREMLERLIDGGYPVLVVLTKSDKLNQGERRQQEQVYQEAFADYEGLNVLPFSAVTGENADKIRNMIDEVIKE